MNERDFCYWLKGFFELTEASNITKEQFMIISEHLDLVFDKKTKLTLEASKKENIPQNNKLNPFFSDKFCKAVSKNYLEVNSSPEVTC